MSDKKTLPFNKAYRTPRAQTYSTTRAICDDMSFTLDSRFHENSELRIAARELLSEHLHQYSHEFLFNCVTQVFTISNTSEDGERVGAFMTVTSTIWDR